MKSSISASTINLIKFPLFVESSIFSLIKSFALSLFGNNANILLKNESEIFQPIPIADLFQHSAAKIYSAPNLANHNLFDIIDEIYLILLNLFEDSCFISPIIKL